jgi:hypothetical protein
MRPSLDEATVFQLEIGKLLDFHVAPASVDVNTGPLVLPLKPPAATIKFGPSADEAIELQKANTGGEFVCQVNPRSVDVTTICAAASTAATRSPSPEHASENQFRLGEEALSQVVPEFVETYAGPLMFPDSPVPRTRFVPSAEMQTAANAPGVIRFVVQLMPES